MSAAMERAFWDRASSDDPTAMIRAGDWAVQTPHDFGMLPPADHGPVLDLGCGLGRLSVPYAKFYKVDVIGVDISPRILERAARHTGVTYVIGDGRAIPPTPKLAGAFSMLMFQHIPPLSQESYVLQVASRLEPGAAFHFQTVIGTENAFLSHQVEAHEPAVWCERAGLQVVSTDQGQWPEWQWVSARKPSAGC